LFGINQSLITKM